MSEKKSGRLGGGQAALRKLRGCRWTWYVLSALSPAVVLLCIQLITQRTASGTAAWFGAAPGAAVLTYLGLLLVQETVCALTCSLFWSVMIEGVPLTILAMASYIKEITNGNPLLVSDLAMAGQVGDLAGFLDPNLKLDRGAYAALFLLVVLLAAVGLLARVPKGSRWAWPKRICVSLCCALVLGVGLWPGSARAMLRPVEGEVQAQRNQRLGLTLGFYLGVLENADRPPDAYSEEGMNSVILEVRNSASYWQEPEVRPNVVMLMSESFCDPLEVLPDIYFSEDPIPNYRAMAQKWPSGHLKTNTCGGGTGNVEMEIFTGIPSTMLQKGEELAGIKSPGAYERVPSIVKAFRDQGYATEYVHSYGDWLYERPEHMPAIGFDKVLFDWDFPEDAEMDGPYLTDTALSQMMISEFEARDPDKPLFLFGLSMENHQPYFDGKFEHTSVKADSELMDEKQIGMVNTLAHGLRGADQGLKVLLDYFEQCGEPVLFIFWGDHLPSLYLGEDKSLYTIAGYNKTALSNTWEMEDREKMFQTPFLVWNNYGADLDVPNTVGVTGLGAQVLDWAGAEKPLYFDWAEQARRDVLLYRPGYFVDGAGQAHQSPPPEAKPTIDLYEKMVYDIVYGQCYLGRELTMLPSQMDGPDPIP